MRFSTPLVFIFLAGCSTLLKPPQDSPPQAEAIPPAAATVPDPAAKPSPPPPSAGTSVAKAGTPAAKAPAKGSAPAAPPAAARKPDAPARQEGPAPLDLKTLEQQLKETKAIGVLTKLSLKNQVDDLLEQFRAYYQGRLKTTLADLRRPYELLLMKVLAVLQDGDPALAGKINASREAIWGILADPDKFAKAGT